MTMLLEAKGLHLKFGAIAALDDVALDATAEPCFDICYGVSDNQHRWVDLENSRARLGFVAQDGL